MKHHHPLNILLAGGGTGGHLFPGIAVAQTFQADDPRHTILFVGTGRPLESAVLSKLGFAHERITAYGIKGMGTGQMLKAMLSLPRACIQSAAIIARFNPDIVIGLGGYASGPLIIMAGLMGIKTVLLEQNTIPGITNRLLSFVADRIFVAFEKTRFRCAASKIHVAGNPVRKEIAACRRVLTSGPRPETARRPFCVAVLGGSQGARSVNLAVTEALKELGSPEDFHFIHQTGAADESWVIQAYESCGAHFRAQAFFSDMAQIYAQADLVICRAGATTIAEITAAAKPAVFIPYPFAADNHQTYNALALVETRAAAMIADGDLSGKRIAERILYYQRNPDILSGMAANAARQGRINAANDIVRNCRRLLV